MLGIKKQVLVINGVLDVYKRQALYVTVEQAVRDLNLDATLVKEEDILKIMEYNICLLYTSRCV